MSLSHIKCFAIVGLMGYAINIAIFAFLLHLGWTSLACASLAFLAANINGFFWHRLFTFADEHTGAAHNQYAKFITISLAAFALNLFWLSIFSLALATLIAQSLAVALSCVVNFAGNRYWTFPHRAITPV